MKREEAINWIYEHCKEKISPFEAITDLSVQTTEWHCWGCEGKFISKWPDWEKPTLKTFPHKRNCKYIEALKLIFNKHI